MRPVIIYQLWVIIHVVLLVMFDYCESSNIREFLIPAYFARRTKIIQESRDFFIMIVLLKKNKISASSKLREKSQNRKFLKI